MKYNIGDIVLIKQGKRGDYYRSLNGVGIIIEVYNQTFAEGYRVIIAGKINETFFADDKDIVEKIE